ncbi:MAG: hypothetical protein H6738_10295 [Alphaproteobacteria bacterium]|nr:hypothetical protein [Alphaproteobacteria bacterium]
MPILVLSAAFAAPPRPLDDSLLPAFPAGIEGMVHEVCALEMVTQEDGRQRVLDLSGCAEPFADAVRTRVTWWTWRYVATETPDLLDPTHALLTGTAGVPTGLYTRLSVVFDRSDTDAEPTIAFQPQSVVALRKRSKVTVPATLAPELGAGCDLLVHVGASGRPVRIQSQTCAESVRAVMELPLMGWTFEELHVEGHPPEYAVRVHLPAL